MNDILDNLIGVGHDNQHPEREGHSFRTGAQLTDSGARYLETRTAAVAAGAYRGLGKDVSGLANDPKAILTAGGLDWKTVPLPLLLQGKTENRPFPGMVGLVRSDNGTPLAVATESYKPHQNPHLVGTMCQFANEAGLTISRIGLFDGGARGWAVASSGVQKEAKVGDVVAMRIVLKFGHAPGTATTFQAWAEELRCSNGAVVEVAAGRARFVHSAELTPSRISEARMFVKAAAEAFGRHVDVLADLRRVKSTKGIDLLLLTELFQPALAVQVKDRMRRNAGNAFPAELAPGDQSVVGKQYIAQLLESDQQEYTVAQMVRQSGGRLLEQIIEATVRQPGGEMTVGSMAHAYSGVTNYNSNVRGRQAETGLEANLFGVSGNDSKRALAMAVGVANAVREM